MHWTWNHWTASLHLKSLVPQRRGVYYCDHQWWIHRLGKRSHGACLLAQESKRPWKGQKGEFWDVIFLKPLSLWGTVKETMLFFFWSRRWNRSFDHIRSLCHTQVYGDLLFVMWLWWTCRLLNFHRSLVVATIAFRSPRQASSLLLKFAVPALEECFRMLSGWWRIKFVFSVCGQELSGEFPILQVQSIRNPQVWLGLEFLVWQCDKTNLTLKEKIVISRLFWWQGSQTQGMPGETQQKRSQDSGQKCYSSGPIITIYLSRLLSLYKSNLSEGRSRDFHGESLRCQVRWFHMRKRVIRKPLAKNRSWGIDYVTSKKCRELRFLLNPHIVF